MRTFVSFCLVWAATALPIPVAGFGQHAGRLEFEVASIKPTTLDPSGPGEVYRARDRKLNRDVAIKMLPAAMANDAQ